MRYNSFKAVHLLGVMLFLGNIIVTGVWKVLADRTQNPRVIAYAQRLVTLTVWISTAGGAARIFAAGNAVPESFWRYCRRWHFWGTATIVIPLANL
jgi:uncharacterized membrane protein